MSRVRGWLMASLRAMRHPHEVLDVLRAGAAMRHALRELRDAPTGSLADFEASANASVVKERLPRDLAHEARRWARAVQRAQRVGPWRGACLARSLALHRLLEANGIVGSRVCVGVQGAVTGFAAHAWVEVAGTVFGDRPGVAQLWAPLATGQSQTIIGAAR